MIEFKDFMDFVDTIIEPMIIKNNGRILKYWLNKDANLYENYIEVNVNGIQLFINDDEKEIFVVEHFPASGSVTEILLMKNCSFDDYYNVIKTIYRIK